MNRIWNALAVLAAVFPFAAVIYELGRQSPLAAAVTAIMCVVLVVALVVAWRTGPDPVPTAEAAPPVRTEITPPPPAERGALPPFPRKKDQGRPKA